LNIEIVLVATAESGFALRQWILKHKPSVEVMLAGSVEMAAGASYFNNDGLALNSHWRFCAIAGRHPARRKTLTGVQSARLRDRLGR
jgi:hypothetical protein